MLGLQWDIQEDTLSVVISKKFPSQLHLWKPTKRNFLSALVSVFDPLGLLGPLLIAGKIFVQLLWKLKVS